MYSYIKSRHLVVPSRNDGPVDMDIGALKGKKGYKGKGNGMYKGKGKGYGFKGKECSKEKEKERAKVSKERKEKEKDKVVLSVVIRTIRARNALKEKEECQL